MFFALFQPSLVILGLENDAHAVVIFRHPLVRIDGDDGKGISSSPLSLSFQ
jgi:hypothetical protein